MLLKVLKVILEFLIGLVIGLFLFSILIKNKEILRFFANNNYAVHLYAITNFILSGIYCFWSFNRKKLTKSRL